MNDKEWECRPIPTASARVHFPPDSQDDRQKGTTLLDLVTSDVSVPCQHGLAVAVNETKMIPTIIGRLEASS